MMNLPMNISTPCRVLVSVCMAFVASSSATAAEIYKWVDAAGKTHYSENKKDAEAANARPLELKVLPPSSPSSNPRVAQSSSPEASIKPPARTDSHFARPAAQKQKPISSLRDETDAGKCHLARSILNGSARHSNMKPTDAYDRQVAESDVRIFCK